VASLQPAEVVAAPLVWRLAVEVAVFWLPQAVVAVTLVGRRRVVVVAVTLVGRPRAAVAAAVTLVERPRAVVEAAVLASDLAAPRERRAAPAGRPLLARAGRAVGPRAPAGLVAAELVDPAVPRPAASES